METRLLDLRYREVINVSTGVRLGFISDAVINLEEGRIQALIVPGPTRFFGLFGREDDYILPWSCITRLGEDIILIDGTAEIRRGRRERKGLL